MVVSELFHQKGTFLLLHQLLKPARSFKKLWMGIAMLFLIHAHHSNRTRKDHRGLYRQDILQCIIFGGISMSMSAIIDLPYSKHYCSLIYILKPSI